SAVDDDEIRHFTAFFAQAAVSPLDGFRHAAKVVRREQALRGDSKKTIVRFLGLSIFENDQRRDAVCSLKVRHVKRLDPPGRRGELQDTRQPLQRQGLWAAGSPKTDAVSLLRVGAGELDPFGRGAAPRRAHFHLLAAPGREEFFQKL